MFKISRILYNNKQYLMNLLEYQKIGINLQLYNSRCDIEKFFLINERVDIDKIQDKLHQDLLSYNEINNLIKDIHKYKNSFR